MKPLLLIPAVVRMAASPACSVSLQAVVTSTPIVLPPTITVCPFVENPGPPPPDLVKRAQDAFAASGLAGTLKVTGEGEYSFTQFLLRSVSIEFSSDVADLNNTATMKTLVARLKEFPVKEVLGNANFCDIKIRVRAGSEFCCWDDVQGCGSAMPLSQP